MRILFPLLTVMLLLIPVFLSAGPILVCDPYPPTELQPTKFVVVLDGKAVDVLPEQYPDGSSALRYDLGTIADGVHTVKVTAVTGVVKVESAQVTTSFLKTGSQITRIKDEAEKIAPSRSLKGYLKDER